MLRIACLMLCLLLPTTGQAAERVALVIGNSVYDRLPDLRYPGQEANDLANALKQQGFEVTILRNATRRQMIRALSDLNQSHSGAELFALFYAGYAASHDSRGYLLPTDSYGDPTEFEFEGVTIDAILSRMSITADSSVVFLDVHSPFSTARLARFADSANFGIALMGFEPPSGTAVISYAPLGDPLAGSSDATRRDYSPLVRELMEELAQDGATVDEIARTIGEQLNAFSVGERPLQYQSMLRPGVTLGLSVPKAAPSAAPQVAAAPSSNANNDERQLFERAIQSGDPEMLSLFLQLYPASAYAPVVMGILSEVQSETAKAAAPKPAPSPMPSVAPKPAQAAKPSATAGGTFSKRKTTTRSPNRGWSVAGEKPTPSFPWPPPQPSGTVLLPIETIQKAVEGEAVGDVMKFVERVLNDQGYHDRSYWSVPGGAALATRLERIDRDGQPITTPTRWPTAKLESDFSLGAYLKSLFYTQPGYFRVIVFVL